MLYSRRCYSSGPEDTSRSLSHVTVHTSELGSVRSLPKASRSFSFRGWSKHCPRCYMFPCSCSLPAWLCSYGMLISRFSNWCCPGSAFAQLSTDASLSCQFFVMTAHTIPRSHCRRGTLLLGYHFSSFGFFGGSTCSVSISLMPMIAFETWRKVVANCLCRACRRQPRKPL